MDDDRFPLTVSVSAEEWTGLQRRLRYIEAAFVQQLRGERRLKEWFTAAQLATLRLPGLPATRQGISRRASAGGWRHRIATGIGGERYEYHFAGLPRAAFETLIQRILTAMPVTDDGSQAPAIPIPPAPVKVPPGTNTAPPWVLPLMRLIRGKPIVTLDEVMRQLPARLPAGMDCPSRQEVMNTLRGLGIPA
jgi:hypothetical protein